MYKRHRGGSGQAAATRQRPWGLGRSFIDESLVCGLNLAIYVSVYETEMYIYAFVVEIFAHEARIAPSQMPLGAEARAALASAALAQTNALQAAGLHLAVEAQERVLEAEGELQRRVAEASAGLAQAKAPRNHPVNLAFSPGGIVLHMPAPW